MTQQQPTDAQSEARLDPVVLWISGAGGTGKSTLATMLRKYRLQVFQTDSFFWLLRNWCPDKEIVDAINRFGHEDIGEFQRHMESQGKSQALAELLLDPVHGLNIRQELCVVEGYLRPGIQRLVNAELRRRGCRVWMADQRSRRNRKPSFTLRRWRWIAWLFRP